MSRRSYCDPSARLWLASQSRRAATKRTRSAPIWCLGISSRLWPRQGTPWSPNQVLVELAMEALDRREWPATDTEIRVARASLFAAQAIARRLIADGREADVQEIRDFISTIVPDPDA